MMDITKAIRAITRQQAEQQAKNQARILGLPYINLVNYPVAPEVLNIMPENLARSHRFVPYLRLGKNVRLAAINPTDLKIPEAIAQIPDQQNYEFSFSVASPEGINYVLELYKLGAAKSEKTGKMQVAREKEKEFVAKFQNITQFEKQIEGASATNLLELLFSGAVKFRASDLHLEPEEERVRVRFRIDGVLQDIVHLAKDDYQGVLARVKNLAKIKLDIAAKPQDGRFEITIGEQKLDIRISTFPTNFGEMIEMRLLSSSIKTISLEELGFRPEALELIKSAISRPHGIILNTGPTGSGKTTTLYAILSRLNKPGVKILTLEDPIEYQLEGIDQSQIDVSSGYTFPIALRSALRQDPDVVMVGEIRDAETAEIAMQAAMTGHLVLSTLHTNDAASTFPRLIDMGVKPFLIAGTVNLVIAQRLIRRLCQNCGGKGCEECSKIGYKGRMVIAEVLKIGPEIEKLIKEKATVHEFEKAAKNAGMKTMTEDGMEKVKDRLTSKEEIERVTKE